jgi:hypothetical protein
MNLNKLARWAGVTAFSVIVPAVGLAKVHHAHRTHPTTSPSSLVTHHTKAGKLIKSSKTAAKLSGKLSAKKAKVRSLKTVKTSATKLKHSKMKASSLRAKKHVATKLSSRKHASAKLSSKKLVASKVVAPAPAM